MNVFSEADQLNVRYQHVITGRVEETCPTSVCGGILADVR